MVQLGKWASLLGVNWAVSGCPAGKEVLIFISSFFSWSEGGVMGGWGESSAGFYKATLKQR